VITKIDLAAAVEFDRQAALSNIESVRPGIRILEVSAKTGAGMAEWRHWLQSARRPPLTSAEGQST
jgi:hydrogenase nickel incorporation protein HypB